ncbi:alpha/beta fold hydrolase [Mycobacterium sp. 852002-40037_SCH5390672]|uniref:alpha/beta fold hydrolase n=1 Tax=Mycobacterium sp. 852002-40037_SCH5390672 TaxID=1834089 RepID=UPI00080573D6|nr:alpha/beta hydrolase [Mycobacterium sp. 852002-40037_SCH5390672]OBB94639.1 hypothetical protein A5782_08985 [Mycobacterium sp. 852002-40037_SCH5390672]
MGTSTHRLEHEGLTIQITPPAPGRLSVLLIHGLLDAGWMWEAVLDALAQHGYGTISFDKPLAAHTHADNLNALSQSLISLCDKLPDSAPVLCGSSLGALTALHLAVSCPKRWPGLVLAGPSGIAGSLRSIDLGTHMRTPSVGLATFFLDRIFYRKELLTPDKLTRFNENLTTSVLIRALRSLRATRDYDVRSLLPQIQQPTLVLCGEDDEISPAVAWRDACENLVDGEFVGIPECGHAPQCEEPALFTGILLEWLARQTPSGHSSNLGTPKHISAEVN